MKKKPFYRVVAMSDTHCGSGTGLVNYYDEPMAQTNIVDYRERREELWKEFTKHIKALGFIDHILMVGDLINGVARGKAQRDNICNVEEQQVVIAKGIFDWVQKNVQWSPKNLTVVEGTEFHVGDGSLESAVAEYFTGKAATKGKVISLFGHLFDVKHKIGGSNRPHLHGNALKAEYQAAVANADRHGTKIPDIMIRAHRHIYDAYPIVHHRGGKQVSGIAIILPALQTWGSDYGKQVTASLFPDVGFVVIDIYRDGRIDTSAKLFHLASQL